MDFQLLIVVSLIGLATAYVARAAVRAFLSPGKGCSSGCGKCAAPAEEVPNAKRVSLQQVSRP
ncbi:MAG TPA: hypothetical protein VGJ05_01955 [Fimbriiglobus sp.]